jgi:glycine/serine hydroxymethyltransferase
MTTRGMKEKDFEQVGQFIHRAVTIASKVQANCQGISCRICLSVILISDRVCA